MPKTMNSKTALAFAMGILVRYHAKCPKSVPLKDCNCKVAQSWRELSELKEMFEGLEALGVFISQLAAGSKKEAKDAKASA
jgi:hypothetical protein